MDSREMSVREPVCSGSTGGSEEDSVTRSVWEKARSGSERVSRTGTLERRLTEAEVAIKPGAEA